jgi:hypothetical protein
MWRLTVKLQRSRATSEIVRFRGSESFPSLDSPAILSNQNCKGCPETNCKRMSWTGLPSANVGFVETAGYFRSFTSLILHDSRFAPVYP